MKRMDAESVTNSSGNISAASLGRLSTQVRAETLASAERQSPAELLLAPPQTTLAWGRLFLPRHFAKCMNGSESNST
jgi:hypothetical protein